MGRREGKPELQTDVVKDGYGWTDRMIKLLRDEKSYRWMDGQFILVYLKEIKRERQRKEDRNEQTNDRLNGQTN